MTTYIALLRGINVSGHNKIKMVALKQSFIQLGFNEVVTYIQSGNIIFQTKENDGLKIEQQIITQINKDFGHTIKALVLSKKQLNTVFVSNLFLKRKTIDIKTLYVAILKDNFDVEGIKQIEPFLTNSEEIKIVENYAFLYYPNSAGNSKLSTNLIERKLKTTATSRNWRTITKLIELSNN
jgi:uncharacterized protein (DUF1697 family)